MTIYDIATDIAVTGASAVTLVVGDTVIIESGVTIESDMSNSGYIPGDRSPVRSDPSTGAWDGNADVTLINYGTLGGNYHKGYTDFFSGGGNHFENFGSIITQNACLESQDVQRNCGEGDNYVYNAGYMRTDGVDICFGANPDTGRIGTFGGNAVINALGGDIECTHINDIRLDGGGNLIENDGMIRDTGPREAIWLTSIAGNAANTVINTGMIADAGSNAIIAGDAGCLITNTGTITGDIQFGAGNNIYDGRGGILKGTAYGGEGNDLLYGGAADDILRGGGGNDIIHGGKGNDIIVGGSGADTMNGGRGHDTFVFGGTSSAGVNTFDTIQRFHAGKDLLETHEAISHLDIVTSGTLSAATLDSDLAAALTLKAGHAALFTPDKGDLAGNVFLIVDGNDIFGYQAGSDIVIDITGYRGTLTTSDFSQG